MSSQGEIMTVTSAHRCIGLTFALLVHFTFPVAADVFLFRPPGNGTSGNNGSGAGIEADTRRLWKEPILYNGIRLELTISMLPLTMSEASARLRTAYPKTMILESPGCLLLETERTPTERKRVLLVETGGEFPVMRFDIALPASVPETCPPSLVRDLPLPAGARPLAHIRFPDRNSELCIFSFPGPSDAARTAIALRLSSDRWQAADGGKATKNGMVFFRDAPSTLLAVSLHEGPDVQTRGILYQTHPGK
jgi:hypothetical protein